MPRNYSDACFTILTIGLKASPQFAQICVSFDQIEIGNVGNLKKHLLPVSSGSLILNSLLSYWLQFHRLTKSSAFISHAAAAATAAAKAAATAATAAACQGERSTRSMKRAWILLREAFF